MLLASDVESSFSKFAAELARSSLSDAAQQLAFSCDCCVASVSTLLACAQIKLGLKIELAACKTLAKIGSSIPREQGSLTSE